MSRLTLLIAMLIVAAPGLGCESGPTDSEIRAMVDAEVMAALAAMRADLVGPPWPPGADGWAAR